MRLGIIKLLKEVWATRTLWMVTLLSSWSVGRGLSDLLGGYLFGVVGVTLGITTFTFLRIDVRRHVRRLEERKEK